MMLAHVLRGRTERRRGRAADMEKIGLATERDCGVVLVKLRGDPTGEPLTAEIAEKSCRGAEKIRENAEKRCRERCGGRGGC